MKIKTSFFYVFIILLSSLWSCEGVKEDTKPSEIQIIDTSKYGSGEFRFPKLVPLADTIIKDWPVFKDFKGVSINLYHSTLEDLQRKSNYLLMLTDSLARSLPDTLNTRSIVSRISVVQTRVNLLKQEVGLSQPKAENIENYINESHEAIINFVLQINEKVQKDQIDLQRKEDELQELEKQRKARDSIFALEMKDQTP